MEKVNGKSKREKAMASFILGEKTHREKHEGKSMKGKGSTGLYFLEQKHEGKA